MTQPQGPSRTFKSKRRGTAQTCCEIWFPFDFYLPGPPIFRCSPSSQMLKAFPSCGNWATSIFRCWCCIPNRRDEDAVNWCTVKVLHGEHHSLRGFDSFLHACEAALQWKPVPTAKLYLVRPPFPTTLLTTPENVITHFWAASRVLPGLQGTKQFSREMAIFNLSVKCLGIQSHKFSQFYVFKICQCCCFLLASARNKIRRIVLFVSDDSSNFLSSSSMNPQHHHKIPSSKTAVRRKRKIKIIPCESPKQTNAVIQSIFTIFHCARSKTWHNWKAQVLCFLISLWHFRCHLSILSRFLSGPLGDSHQLMHVCKLALHCLTIWTQ